MATVEHLLPRHWDGRRLLQFLTGLALIALAFAIPAHLPVAQPVEPPALIVTTVDTPTTAGLPVINVPAPAGSGGNLAPLAMEAPTAETPTTTTEAPGPDSAVPESASTETTTEIVAESAGTKIAGTESAGTEAAGAGFVALGAFPAHAPAHRGDRRICAEGRAAVHGISPRGHGERAPPRI